MNDTVWSELNERLKAQIETQVRSLKLLVDKEVKAAQESEILSAVGELVSSVEQLKSFVSGVNTRLSAIEAKLAEDE